MLGLSSNFSGKAKCCGSYFAVKETLAQCYTSFLPLTTNKQTHENKETKVQDIQFIYCLRRETPNPFNQGFEIGISKESHKSFCILDYTISNPRIKKIKKHKGENEQNRKWKRLLE